MDDAIYREVQTDLIRYATALVGPDEAEDVVSTVITRLYASERTLSDLDEPKPYLMKAVYHASVDRSRRASSLPLSDQAIEPAASQPEVLEAVLRLPVQQRAATFLSYWVGMTSEEAGRVMDCNPGTVRHYLHLARTKLEAVLDGE